MINGCRLRKPIKFENLGVKKNKTNEYNSKKCTYSYIYILHEIAPENINLQYAGLNCHE